MSHVPRLLQQLREAYAASDQRPYKIDGYLSNHQLLKEGLNVFWNNMELHLRYWLIKNRHDNVKALLESEYLKDKTIKNIPLYCSPSLIDKIVGAGVIVEFNLDQLSGLEDDRYEVNQLQYSIDVATNVHNHLSDYIPRIMVGRYYLLRQFFKLVNRPYHLYVSEDIDCSKNLDIHLEDVFELDNLETLLQYCLINQSNGFVEVILSKYTPPVENLINEYLVSSLTRNRQSCSESYYQSMIKRDSLLSECINPVLKEYWSIIPTDNENFLKFLEWSGIELPPSIGVDCSATRISCNPSSEAIETLIKMKCVLPLIQLMYRKAINIRDYSYCESSIVDRLIPYQLITQSC